MNDPLDSAIPVGSGPGTTVPPAGETPPPVTTVPPSGGTPPPPATSVPPPVTPPPAARPVARTAPAGNDKIWAILCHVSGFIGVPFILPIVVYLAMKDDSAYVADNAKEALNFHISIFIYTLCLLPLVWLLLGIPLLVVLVIAGFVLSIVAAIKAADGNTYRYPMTIRLVS